VRECGMVGFHVNRCDEIWFGGRLQELTFVLYKVPARHAALKIHEVHI
jgi:hypothetical protein